jgi:FkbM family methyltransferase
MAIKKIIKLFMQKSILKSYQKYKSFFYKKYYSFKFKPLIIRKNTSDEAVFQKIFLNKEYNLPIKIEPELIIDGGANVGYASIWFANKFPKAEIIAIEPENSNFNVLKKNTCNFPNIKLIKAGIWDKNTNLKINRSHFNWSGKWDFYVKACKKKSKNTVKSITINQILKKSKHGEIDILKLDIEGAEKEIFSNNYKQWLDKVKILIIELHETYKKGCTKAFYSAIKKYDFLKFQKGENIILVKKNAIN